MRRAISQRFTTRLRKSPAPGGWTYVVWAMGDGTHKLPVKADVRKAIGKEAGQTVEVVLRERLD